MTPAEKIAKELKLIIAICLISFTLSSCVEDDICRNNCGIILSKEIDSNGFPSLLIRNECSGNELDWVVVDKDNEPNKPRWEKLKVGQIICDINVNSW